MGFKIHKNEVLGQLNRKIKKALTECGLAAEVYAEEME